jgi:hypothetical protein
VVLAILGLLVSIAIVRGYRAIQRARQSAAMDTMKDISVYIANKAISAGQYPAALTMTPCPGCPPVPYLRKDPWGHVYVYQGQGDSFTLRCLGRDGQPSAGVTPATRDDFDLDIVMKDGRFLNEPYLGS